MAQYKGNDVSYCQEGLDIAALKANGSEFVIIRAGLATSKDVTMDAFVRSAAKAGMPYGFYWYSYAQTPIEAVGEAKACVDVIKGFDPVLPVFYDVERVSQIQLPGDVITDIYAAFCEEIKSAGFTPGIYINPSFWNKCDNAQFAGCDIWLAHYVKNSTYTEKTKCAVWQWGTEKVGGYTVDANIGYKKYWSDTKPAPAAPAPASCTLAKGDKATVKADALFVGGIKPFTFVYKTEFDVMRISKDGKEALIGLDGCATGWMYTKDLIKKTAESEDAKPAASAINKGNKVKVRYGAKFSDGTKPYTWVYNTVFDVHRVSSNGKEALIGLDGKATGWVFVDDLQVAGK